MSDCFNFLIPRATFDRLADDHGADRLTLATVCFRLSKGTRQPTTNLLIGSRPR
jgi:hypothetical protein